MTDTDMNREVCEALGILRHFPKCGTMEDLLNSTSVRSDNDCICGQSFRLPYDLRDHIFSSNPDFSDDAGAVALLRLMRERKYFQSFLDTLEAQYHTEMRGKIHVDYITTEGKMLKAVHEWFKEKGVIR